MGKGEAEETINRRRSDDVSASSQTAAIIDDDFTLITHIRTQFQKEEEEEDDEKSYIRIPLCAVPCCAVLCCAVKGALIVAQFPPSLFPWFNTITTITATTNQEQKANCASHVGTLQRKQQ